jgi:hypothetical protein
MPHKLAAAKPPVDRRSTAEPAVSPAPSRKGPSISPRISRVLKHQGKVRASPSSARAGVDPVDCSVFAPPTIAMGTSVMVQVFAHLPQNAEEAREHAREHDDDAARRALVSLDLEIPPGERLWFELSIPGLAVDTPVQSLVWRRLLQSLQFLATAPRDGCCQDLFGSVRVSLGEHRVPIGHLKFKIEVVSERTSKNYPEPAAKIAHRYRKAFISYSTHDIEEVLKRVQMVECLHVDYFQDFQTIKPGQRWEQELYRNIDECDVFLLFWSRSARDSEWVMKEVRYAMKRKGDDDDNPPELIPVIIEGPPPVEPPEDLKHINFNDRLLYFMKAVSQPTTA